MAHLALEISKKWLFMKFLTGNNFTKMHKLEISQTKT